MKLIPEEWSIGVISQFLSGSVRLSLHKSRKTKILRSLARGENIKASLYCKSISARMTWFTFSHTMLIMKSVHHISLFSCKQHFLMLGLIKTKRCVTRAHSFPGFCKMKRRGVFLVAVTYLFTWV